MFTDLFPIDFSNFFYCLDRSWDIRDEIPGNPIFYNFGNRPEWISNDRGATRHSLYHHDSEWFRPGDRKQKGRRISQKFTLLRISDFSDELYVPAAQQRLNDGLEIFLIALVHLRSNLQRHPRGPGDLNCTIQTFFRRCPSQEGKIVAALSIKRITVNPHTVVHR